MALSGSAFLALWNDVDPEVEADYERWHTLEHVPERVGIPGFLSGRRYRSEEAGQPRYFTLYEVLDASVFESAAYRDVIEHPTPWSAAMRPRLRNVVRATCETARSTTARDDRNARDTTTGAPALVSARFSCWNDAQLHADVLLATCAGLPGVRGVHLGTARNSVPPAFRQWSQTTAPSHVLLIEGDDEAALRAMRTALAAAIDMHGHARESAEIDTYALAFGIAHAQVDATLRRTSVRGSTPALPFDATSGH